MDSLMRVRDGPRANLLYALQFNWVVFAGPQIASMEATVKTAALVASLLICGAAVARDVGQIASNFDPKISAWFRAAKSPGGAPCCDEADGYREGIAVRMPRGEPTVIFRSWWAASDGYHLLDPRDLTPTSMKILPIAVMLVHSWYDEKCCHDKDCHPVPCEEIEKISDGWLWRDAATKQRYWFPHDRLKASHDDACHVCVSPKTIPSGICLYVPLPA